MELWVIENGHIKCYISVVPKEYPILDYIDDPNIWKYWLMEGIPKPHVAAALLTNWLSQFETGTPEHNTGFWTQRAAMFYTSVRWINYNIRGEWGERAEIVNWNDFLSKISAIPKDTGFIFFPGKFRTLPTLNQVETVYFGLENLKTKKIVSALIYEPRENVSTIEGEKIVLDDQIRKWAYSQLPVNAVTSFPIIKEGENVTQFYTDRYKEIRNAKRGYVGVAVGASIHRNEIIRLSQQYDIEVVDTSIGVDDSFKPISSLDTTDFDNLSSKSDLANELILKYLQHMGQI
ncbi:MAG: hypothetical protein UT24_C0009G0064 [Candidatus Woesebacteria bacterium GW2011_GWB1_39_12]|uniref:Uncharacterized protein n=2 Tax=Candidatus Woeseibacteriota TaxID=1752722 RepID=A0A0G0PK97_9BACT|nr:MAG: hypothetical protein UT23_C0002G0064 [Candidatus Woesebacteria bacterium GW2011_GWA1_39_12]KKR00747.1 MAG: hypothetical protein UT24_C0009G0064 [Candidatus Woesebacteria bacterium GW2011_GWB1_39_12]